MKRWSFHHFSGCLWYTPFLALNVTKREQVDVTFCIWTHWWTLTYWIEPALNGENYK